MGHLFKSLAEPVSHSLLHSILPALVKWSRRKTEAVPKNPTGDSSPVGCVKSSERTTLPTNEEEDH